MFWRFGIGGRQPPRRRDQLVERGVDAPRPRMDERREGVRVRALELRELAVLQDLPRERVPEGQLLQDVHVGGVAGLRALERRQLQLLEEHDRELLRRVRVDRLPGELVDLPQERVELRVELLRQPAQALRVGPDPEPLHVGEDGDQRHLERLVEGRERVLAEQRPLGLGEPPHARRPGAGPRGNPRRVHVAHRRAGQERLERAGHPGPARLGRQLVERIPAPPGVQEIRRHRRVVDAPRAQGDLRAARPGDEGLRVVPHERHVGGKLRPARVVGRAGGRRVRRHAVEGEVRRAPPEDGLDGEAPARAERGTRATPPGRPPARSRQAGPRRAPGPGAAARRTRARSRARAAAPTGAPGPESSPGRTRWGAPPRGPPADARGRPGRDGAPAPHGASGR